MIQSYFSKVRLKIRGIAPLVKTEQISFDMVSPEMGIIKGRIIFIDRTVFEFRELISNSDHDYRFHWMDSRQRLIVRWDTAPHYKELENFPFHRHDGKKVQSSAELMLVDVLDYIKKSIIRSL